MAVPWDCVPAREQKRVGGAGGEVGGADAEVEMDGGKEVKLKRV